ncbi:ATPase [Aeromicrobium flavum]|uniref:ATPase n=1 Tax=Aeromicrobium flavum TaxID=416568 RepID=A0A512HRR7_9ACTN|nr:SRPBCC family protein [Aeromicrobium flavum]GEO88138.1 ATPase [Aeromicrobium flavum]
MTPDPTGRRETRDGRAVVVLTRTFDVPVEDVWAAITVSERLERWIGTWTGDPAAGTVQFRMNAEGEDVQAEPFTIHRCEPPHVLAVSSRAADGEPAFELLLELTEADGTTTLTFSQPMSDPELAADVGPGWEYYLDRLMAAEAGDDVAAIDFNDYHPAQSDHYRQLFA